MYLRPIFFNICNLPFSSSANIGKIKVKIEPKTTLRAPAPSELQFSVIYLHRYVANKGINKTVAATFFF